MEKQHASEDAATSEDDTRKSCIECAEDIASEAAKCRHCGAYQRRYHRWSTPLVTILSLLVAVISLIIGAEEQIRNLVYPKAPIFAVLEDSETGGRDLVLVAHNESDDSLVVHDMMCFMAFSTDPTEKRFMDSHWYGDQSAIIAPGTRASIPVQWMASADVVEAASDVEKLPRASISVRRWSSTCGCDPDRDMNEMIEMPVTVCRIYYRTSRQTTDFYDFRAPILDSSMSDMISRWDDLDETQPPAVPEEVRQGYDWPSNN